MATAVRRENPVTDDLNTVARVEQEKTLIEWKGVPRLFKQRKNKEFMTVPLVIAGLLLLVLLTAGEWVPMMGVAAVVFVYYIWSTVPPTEMEYSLTTRGVRAAGQLYEWEKFTRWWWTEKAGVRILSIEMPGSMLGRLHIPIMGAELVGKVEGVMNKMLLQEKPQDTWMDKAVRWVSEKFPLE